MTDGDSHFLKFHFRQKGLLIDFRVDSSYFHCALNITSKTIGNKNNFDGFDLVYYKNDVPKNGLPRCLSLLLWGTCHELVSLQTM